MDWLNIIISLVDGLLGVVVAGFAIWLFQFNHIEKTQRSSVYIKRLEAEEDEFYKKIKTSRDGFYCLCRSLKNGENITQDTVNSIVENLQLAFDSTKCSGLVLGKYNEHVNTIFNNYNVFSEAWNKANNMQLTKEEYQTLNDNFIKAKDSIFIEYDKIDRIYFNID